jgi:ABC-type sugar transport system ATPase subunit
MEQKILLEVNNLCKYFGGLKANDNINLKVHEREIVALVGDNGAGKSTFIKTLAGAHRMDSGEIIINGEKANITSANSAKEYGIETVYQDQVLIKRFNAASNLFLGREQYQNSFFGKLLKFLDFKKMEQEAKSVLDKIGITMGSLDSPVSDLSGGQRRAIEVGRAVFWGGKFIIFDEPCNGLGVEQQEKVLQLIKNLRKKFNVAILIVSHNLNHVFELVDKIVVLRNGRKVGERLKDETTKEEIVSMITGSLSA